MSPLKRGCEIKRISSCAKGINYLWPSSDKCSLSVPPNCCCILSDSLSSFTVVDWLPCRTNAKCLPYANTTVSFKRFSCVGAIYSNRCVQHMQLMLRKQVAFVWKRHFWEPPRRKAFSRCGTCLVSDDSVWRIVGSRGPHHRPNCDLSKRHVSGNLNPDDNVRMRGWENFLALPPCKQKHLLFLKQKLGRKIT